MRWKIMVSLILLVCVASLAGVAYSYTLYRQEKKKTHCFLHVKQILVNEGFTAVDGAITGDFWGYDRKVILDDLNAFMSIAKQKNVEVIYYHEDVLDAFLCFLDDARDTLYICRDASSRWVEK